jgi:hypothetical protein
LNRKLISLRISDSLGDLNQLKSMLRALDTLDLSRFPKNYENMSTEAALLAEKITCKLRSLIYASTGIRKPQYLTQAASAHDVRIEYQNGILCITLPRLLPRRGGKYSSLFLTEPIHAALERYGNEQQLPKFLDCTICMVHEYDASCADRLIFDFDNLQQKQLMDTIAVHILTDDNALLCDVFCTSRAGERDRTLVFIMEKNAFPEWLSGAEMGRKVISDF